MSPRQSYAGIRIVEDVRLDRQVAVVARCPECEGTGIGRKPKRYICERCDGQGLIGAKAKVR